MFSPVYKPSAQLRISLNGKRKSHVVRADEAAGQSNDVSNAGNRDAVKPRDATLVAADNSTENVLPRRGDVPVRRRDINIYTPPNVILTGVTLNSKTAISQKYTTRTKVFLFFFCKSSAGDRIPILNNSS